MKEDRYEAALERARKLRDGFEGYNANVAIIAEIFPELRESEDERIRMALCDIVRDMPYMETELRANGLTVEKTIAYLEKQKEQKPAEWSEDWREEDILTRFAFYTYKDDPSVLYLSNVFVEEASRNHGFGTRILKVAEKTAEAMGAITICLKVKQDSPANAWYRNNGYGYVAFEDGYDWLEKNLEYMKPNKQEWEKEDEKMRNNLLYLMEENNSIESWEGCYEWLKSLRPQPHWKPSEEQMKALLNIEGDLRAFQYKDKAKIIAELYEHLKKL